MLLSNTKYIYSNRVRGTMETFALYARLRKQNKSIVVTLPAHACRVLDLNAGDNVTLTIRKEEKVIGKCKKRKRRK